MENLNKEICIKCGVCALNCPLGLIEIDDYPEIPEETADFCVQCGHCMSICPEGAIGSPNLEGRVNGSFHITPLEMGLHMKSRRSIRNYSDKPVEREKLEKIFEIIRYAPTGNNGQPVQWTVINDPEKVNQISTSTINWMREVLKEESHFMVPIAPLVEAWDNGRDPILRSAPCLVVAHAPADKKSALTDGIIALTHLDLLLPSFGMGGCWAGILNMVCSHNPSLKGLMRVPQGNTVIYPFMVGYPRYQYQRIPERNQPEIVWGIK